MSTLAVVCAFSAVLVVHWRKGTKAVRRVLAPVLPTALLYAVVSAAGLLTELGAPVGLGRRWAWVERVALAAVPVAFLAGLLRSRLAPPARPGSVAQRDPHGRRSGLSEPVVERQEEPTWQPISVAALGQRCQDGH